LRRARLWLVAFFTDRSTSTLSDDDKLTTKALVEAGLMTTGSTTSGLTAPDPAVPLQLCASDAALNFAAADAVPAEPNHYPGTTDSNVEEKADSWRVELAARLERYRTRRKPRSPRYPSLLLPFDAPFDAPQSWSRPASADGSEGSGPAALASVPAQIGQDTARQRSEESEAVGEQKSYPYTYAEQLPGSDQSAKVIEFPRYAAIPVFTRSELADPIFDRPRIVEAPEILPPPPALGGMLIEPVHREPAAIADPPAASASIARRALAALVDGVILATALAGFAAIFLRMNPSLNPTLAPSLNPIRGPLPLLAGTLGVTAVLLWMAYEFLFVVYTGSTPGLRAARLRLAKFDGSPLSRGTRRWRVLASFLSAFSAALGYLWCFLDSDGLCWHDRITRTHVRPGATIESETSPGDAS
jgi:uncharacterized RDD family membrane protein YckC